jgi:hypothetical protein
MAEIIQLGEDETLRRLRARANVHLKALNDRIFAEIEGRPMSEVCAVFAALVKLSLITTQVLKKKCGVPTEAIIDLVKTGQI